MEIWQRFKKPLIAVGIVVAAIAIFAVLKATKPQTPLKEVEERFWPVQTQEVAFGDVKPILQSYGEIRAGREAELRAQVSGTVISVHNDLGDGASVRAGDVLVTIDGFDYLATEKERHADLKEAEAKLEEFKTMLVGEEKLQPVDKRQVNLASREVERQRKLLKRSAVSKKAYDDALTNLNDRKQKLLVREQTIARYKSQVIQAESSLEKAKTALSKAQRDVADTQLKAPFEGFLTDTDVTAGKQVSTSDRLGRLISLERLEVSFHVSEADYARLTRLNDLKGRKVSVNVRRGDKIASYEAEIIRIDARVDATTGGRKVFGTLSGLTLNTDLRPGVFVEVGIPDETYQNVVSLPARAVHDNSFVYVVKDGRLYQRQIKVAARDGANMLISEGLQGGDIICVTRFAEMGIGVKVMIK
ncbi:putative HlyD family secretion protein [Candidatus Terasakiella magnetica]|uniref:Putative HlyD family secretion protein n=1 Tax=Candidatus Terasakiella magnetica TaxID=1867952 RepID=A0A1C3REX6_9PROT|nr:efflux RND transporter periplasmic adaptor subunit [Candidatus Terasakiella magnetica]SCA55837.1 putative HlyD family secretion protein [Candidatus Terasakiella magnetica]